MTKEQQNRFLLLFALKSLSNSSSKNEVLNFLLENDLMKLDKNDLQILTTRNEEKWRNELAFVRSHLVKEGFLSNIDRNKWEVTENGIEYFNTLNELLSRTYNPSKINIEVIKEYRHENRNIVNEEREIYKIKSEKSLSKTEKENIILSRIGQGVFRKNLINLYGKCCITNYSFVNILIASHIKPWKFSNNHERLDKYNGLLLLPTYDKLFDLGYITFENSGNIKISKNLINSEKLYLNGNLKIEVSEETKKYLEYHRKNIFIK